MTTPDTTNEKARPESILQLFDDLEIPILTSKIVAQEFECSDQTARTKLAILVEEGELKRTDLGKRQSVWLKSDQKAATEIVQRLREHIDLRTIDVNQLEAFVRQPYKLLPKSENEYWVIVPRFIPFSAGYLVNQDEAWQTYIVNKYATWFDNIPKPILEKIDVTQRYEHAVVENGILELTDKQERDRAWQDFNRQDGPLKEPVDENKLRIESGKEFEVLSTLVENGNLPFAGSPVDKDELKPEPDSIELRPYQEDAWTTFLETGQIGVFWPPGLGKTYISLYAGERLEGQKLVVVPSSTLVMQWKNRIEKLCSEPEDWDVKTYQYITTDDNIQEFTGDNSPKLAILDECHFLPADTYSALSTLDSDHRIGCSASPYREDERTDLIIALTGYPVGIDWQELLKYGELEYPDVSVYLYDSDQEKREDLVRLDEQSVGKTLIFSDGLEAGHELADQLEVPFVNGDTPKGDRMDIFRDCQTVIASRVADEGVSLENLDRVIEYQFLGSSRRQELQRVGRVMHAEGKGKHIVQMTDEEYEQYNSRLYSLTEKGIEFEVQRRSP